MTPSTPPKLGETIPFQNRSGLPLTMTGIDDDRWLVEGLPTGPLEILADGHTFRFASGMGNGAVNGTFPSWSAVVAAVL